MMRYFRVFTYAILLTLCACSSSSDSSHGPEPGSGSIAASKKVLYIPRTDAYRSLDPMKQFDEASSDLINTLYDRLLNYHYLKRPYQLVPGLLVSMPVESADGKTYTMTLRQGVVFNDDPCFAGGKGRELTADDVIYSIKRFADARVNVLSYDLMRGFIVGMDAFREQTEKSAAQTDYSKLDIAGVKKLGKYRIEIDLTMKNPLLMYAFAMSQLSIVPHEAVDKYGDDFERHPVGSGAFFVKVMSRRGDMVLEKNPHYWGTYPSDGDAGDEAAGLLKDAGKKLPLVDEVHLPLIEEAQPRILSFQKGKLDLVGIDKNNFGNFLSYDNGKITLKAEWKNRINAYAVPGLSLEYFKFNMKDALVGGYSKEKIALRQAMAYALDTPKYISLLLNGRAMPLKTIVPQPIAGSERDIDIDYYTYNKEMAKQKLAEAGYPGGKGLPVINFEYRASTTNTRQDWEFIRAQLADIGIKAVANFQTFSAWLKKTERGDYQVSAGGWMADYPDAEDFFQLLYGPNVPPGPNDGAYDNPEYNKLYKEIRFMENGPERFTKFRRMDEIIKHDVPLILRFNTERVGLTTPWLRNMKRNILYNPPLRYLDIDPARKAQGM